jgi:hypothetical protein
MKTIHTTVDAKGRTCYTVAGMVTTYDPQEAIDLTATGVFSLNCPLTRSAVEPRFSHRSELVTDRNTGRPVVDVVGYEVKAA